MKDIKYLINNIYDIYIINDNLEYITVKEIQNKSPKFNISKQELYNYNISIIRIYLRNQREYECFSIINRGQLWYASLTEKQLKELDKWYKEWLDVTTTLKVPNKPEWIK